MDLLQRVRILEAFEHRHGSVCPVGETHFLQTRPFYRNALRKEWRQDLLTGEEWSYDVPDWTSEEEYYCAHCDASILESEII